MDKKKIEIIVLILLIAFGVNYSFYSYYFVPRHDELKSLEIKYNEKKDKITLLRAKKVELQKVKEENDKLKSELGDFDTNYPKAIDTPQLIYDFYISLQKYGLTGTDISFSQDKNALPVQGQNTDKNNTQGTAKSESTNATGEMAALSINLKLYGSISNIEAYVRNIDTITERKLNIKSVNISSRDTGAKVLLGQAASVSRIYSADIVFNHYIQLDNSNEALMKEYEFYDSKIGFDKITDMFN